MTVDIVDLLGDDATANNGPDVVVDYLWVNRRQFEGCTPGFWQGGNGSTLWNEEFDPDWTPAGDNPFYHDTLFNEFFSVITDPALDGLTMYEATSPADSYWPEKVARDLVAAYLNASHVDVDYPFATDYLTAAWYEALEEFLVNGNDQLLRDLHTELDEANNLGCEF